MAHGLQRPWERPRTAIATRGGEGVGKGICWKEYGALFGLHFIHLFSSRYLLGNFNSHLKNALVVHSDEAFWTGDKQQEGVLKAMVTEEFRWIELKGKDPFPVRNYIRLLMSSNDAWVLPAGLDARRFLVIDVGKAQIQNQKYFGEITKQMENGGREALLHFLTQRDISGVDLSKIPPTEALRQTKLYSMTSVQKFWFDRLMAGGVREGESDWPVYVVCEDLYNEYVKAADKIGTRQKVSQTEFGIE